MRTSLTPPKHEVPESPYEAFRAVVHEFGVQELARQELMKPGTLWNKADADIDSRHQPTLRDLIRVTQAADDFRAIESLVRMFGRCTFFMQTAPVSDEALLDLLCRVGSEKGQMQQALLNGYADGKFCVGDFKAVKSEAYDLISAVLTFLSRLEGLIDGPR